mmetsp:Transcript_1948/g.4486  ORF Transcript_1948/g.4486 Transcript_1948/m.4486 type:complete len:383 (+) Transcript_1948:342-1490(+)|eukprot:CAMPEP_0178992324 /NCGR_PEP_ID=MMETSP0795-20121207/6046_1 /TAXON_ID=88552 /ORGANISM="Amoebophrya sp., Strain Ameob2" /LENGTH=382 /DNA_ID=CAMNT_0020684183 /DNA_START=170 /DNA_END=1318 /DNA_ORIENTATION=-
MAAASSSSASASRCAPGSSDSTVSDLLVHYRGNFLDWLPAVRKKAGETLDERCERGVLGAQINWWQVLASRKLAPTSNGRPRFPSDVAGIVLEFLGSVPVSTGLENLSDAIRDRTAAAWARDRFRAMEYYAELLRKAADTGQNEFKITQEVHDAAPRSSLGKAIHPAFVAQYLNETCRLRVWFGPERTSYRHWNVWHASRGGEDFTYPTEAAAYLPLVVQLHHYAEDEVDEDSLVDMGEVIRMHASTSGAQQPTPVHPARLALSANLGSAQRKFVETANAASKKAAEYVIKIASAHFEAGNTRLLFTEELWNAAPKLPSGKLPLLWPGNGAALEFAGGSHNISEHLESVWEQVHHSPHGISMDKHSAETGEPDQLPVELSLD